MSATEKFYTPTPRDMFEALNRPELELAPLTQRVWSDEIIRTVRVLVVRNVEDADDIELLVGVRSEGSNPSTSGKGELLGGKVDPETIALHGADIVAAIKAAACAELGEEGGITIVPHEPEVLGMHIITDLPDGHPRAGAIVIDHYLRAEYVEGEPRVSEEHQSVGWEPLARVYGNSSYRDGTSEILERTGLVA